MKHVVVCLLILGIARPISAASYVFTVDSTLDTNDVTPGNGVCATAGGVCTLRAAIQEANALTVLAIQQDVQITLGAGSGPPAVAVYRPTTNAPYAIAPAAHSGSLVAITGRGAAFDVIDGNTNAAGANDTRLFLVGHPETPDRRIQVQLQDLSVINGISSDAAGKCASAPAQTGGAIQVCRDDRSWTVSDTQPHNQLRISRAQVKNSISTALAAFAGGGIFVDEYSSLIADDTLFQDNTALADGIDKSSAGGALMLGNKAVFQGSRTDFVHNSANSGGAVKTAGRFDCDDCHYFDNSAVGTGGQGGGAIYLDTDRGVHASLRRSLFMNNTAAEVGGALWSGAYTLSAEVDTIEALDSVFVGNSAEYSGGAVYIAKPTAASGVPELEGGPEVISAPLYAFTSCLFYQNHAGLVGIKLGHGGAMASQVPGLQLRNVTFNENTVTGSGGAIYLEGCNTADSAAVVKCAVSDPTSDGKLSNVTMIDNRDLEDTLQPDDFGGANLAIHDGNGNWTFKISNSVLASNVDSHSAPFQPSNCVTDVVAPLKLYSQGHNVVGTTMDPPLQGGAPFDLNPCGFFNVDEDRQSATFDTLANLGVDGISVPAWPATSGGDYVMLPAYGSPLLDKGQVDGAPQGNCESDDQLHTARPQNARCDIGAFERIVPAPVVSFSAATSNVSEEALTHTVIVTLATPYGVDLTVPFAIDAATTAASGEYAVTSTSPLTFTAGSTSVVITFTISAGDTVLDGDKQVVLTLGTPNVGTVGTPSTHTVTVVDDEALPPPATTSGSTGGTAGASSSGTTSGAGTAEGGATAAGPETPERDANHDGFYDDVGASGGGLMRACSSTQPSEALWLVAVLLLRRLRRRSA